MRALGYNPIGMVFLDSGFDGDGIGALAPDDLQISGVTWNASFLDRERIFTCYIDDGSYPGMEEATDSTLGKVAAEEFERMTGAPAEPIHVHLWEPGMPAYDGSWTATEEIDLPSDVYLCSNFVERPGIPGRIRHARRVASKIDG
jgi:oxygen-dependent protoporphyrinogen oxidase